MKRKAEDQPEIPKTLSNSKTYEHISTVNRDLDKYNFIRWCENYYEEKLRYSKTIKTISFILLSDTPLDAAANPK